jgi:hypothetical protein
MNGDKCIPHQRRFLWIKWTSLRHSMHFINEWVEGIPCGIVVYQTFKCRYCGMTRTDCYEPSNR